MYIKPSLTTRSSSLSLDSLILPNACLKKFYGFFFSWLRDFLSYVESSRNFGDTSMQIASESDFVSTLRDIYLSDMVEFLIDN